MAQNKLQVIRLTPGKAPEVAFIDKGLDALQKEVGGYIEVLGIKSGIDAYVNEEGLLDGLPFNRFLPTLWGGGRLIPVVGPAVIAGHDDEGETIGLTDGQVADLLSVLRQTDAVRPARPAAEA